VLAATSLLPLLILSVPWKSLTVQSGDDSPLGIFLTKATGHFVHALGFLTALWIALDPGFSPRHLGLGVPMLSYYYLSALAGGYCAGYFLLLGSRGRKFLPRLGARWIYVMLAAMPLVLVWRNLGQIRFTNGPAVSEFMAQLHADLPAGRSVVLSEDTQELGLLRAELAARRFDKEGLLLETPSLVSAQYHIFMARQFKTRWPVATPTNGAGTVGPLKMLNLVSAFAAREPVVYLHPSSGLFFERFTERPWGSIHYLMPRVAKDGVGRTLDGGIVATNEQIWQQRWTNTLQILAEQTKEKPPYGPSWASALLRALRLGREPNLTAGVLGAAYSKSLDYWGVQMQRLERWPEAGVWFRRALELNPGNLSARVNAEYNQRCQRGDRRRLDAAATGKEFENLFNRSRNWAEILDRGGPVDEPTCLFEVGRVYLAGRNNHQAARELARCVELAPRWPEPKLWLGLSYLDLRDFVNALRVTDSIDASDPPRDGGGLAQLLMCRTTALQGLGRTNEAVACIEGFVQQYKEQGDVLRRAAALFEQNLQFRKELTVLDELLQREPRDLELLAKKGWAELQLARYGAAAATLTTVLSLAQSNEEARLHRAMARLGNGQLEAAREDYEQLLKGTAYVPNALYGLGTVAWREHDTNTAIRLYEQCLSNAMPRSPQFALAVERLRQLKSK
jgi:tetratricopeptide (TPR) repeat protein